MPVPRGAAPPACVESSVARPADSVLEGTGVAFVISAFVVIDAESFVPGVQCPCLWCQMVPPPVILHEGVLAAGDAFVKRAVSSG
jgi:hypothetical protein